MTRSARDRVDTTVDGSCPPAQSEPVFEGRDTGLRAAFLQPAPSTAGRRLAAVRRYLGRPRSPLWLELLFIAWLCWLYDDINNLSPLRQALAFSNGWFLLHFERAVHIDPEAALDHWLAGHTTLGWIAGNYYDNVHFVTTLGLLALIWWKFSDRYRPLRNGLLLTNVAAMVIFWLVPTAPPRLLEPGVYIDIVGQSHSFGSWHTGTLATAANQLAAMPSMHLGWATWSSLAAWRILPRRWWAGLVWVYPVVTAVDVMATGNHYVSDVVAGVVLLALCQFVADRWQGWLTAREARRALLVEPDGSPRLAPLGADGRWSWSDGVSGSPPSTPPPSTPPPSTPPPSTPPPSTPPPST